LIDSRDHDRSTPTPAPAPRISLCTDFAHKK